MTKETNSSMAKSSENHKTPEYREKYEATMIDKYGVPYIVQDAEMKAHIIGGMDENQFRTLWG